MRFQVLISLIFCLFLQDSSVAQNYKVGFKSINKAAALIKDNTNLNRAIKLLEKAEKCDYGFCGNAWASAFGRIYPLKAEAFILQEKYTEALSQLDSVTGCAFGANCLKTDSLKLEVLFKIHDKSTVCKALLAKSDSIISISDNFMYEEFVSIRLEALNANLRLTNHYFFRFDVPEKLTVFDCLINSKLYERIVW